MTERIPDTTKKSSLEELNITTDDGRELSYELSGYSDGVPVFLMHGTPGSKKGIRPRPFRLGLRGIQLISYDRPGYGTSDRQEGRSVVDAAEDVRTLADHLGYDRFGVVGRSGGSPHALACAAKLGERVIRTLALTGLAPPEEMTWEGMAESNTVAFGRETEQDEVIKDIIDRYLRARHDPENILKELDPEMHKNDKNILAASEIRQGVISSYKASLKHGPDGWVDDVLAFRKDWGFNLEDILSPVTFWAAGNDHFSPARYARAMAARVMGSELLIEPNASHFSSIEVLPDALTRATRS